MLVVSEWILALQRDRFLGRHISARWASRPALVVLCGQTGSGKTELLRHLKAAGEQVIDLEGLARHRGSVFGSLVGVGQPSHAAFGNAVASAWHAMDARRAVWIEDEGPFIGSVGVPLALQQLTCAAPAIELVSTLEHRCDRLVAEFGSADSTQLMQALDRAAGRLGTERTRQARKAIESGQVNRAVPILLTYYDAAYAERARRRPYNFIARIESDLADCAARCIQALRSWQIDP